VGGFPDLVKRDETGWVVRPRKPAELAEAILNVLRDPVKAREIALKGQVLARSMFDVRQTACQVAAIYHKIMTSHPGQRVYR
jgi:glycosyltransferase involved in cell wall biosynthesis